MQPGFAMLESGLTRSKNSINVAVKNLTDLGISVLLYWAFGFALMFGASHTGLFGKTNFFLDPNKDFWLSTFFFFQAMFCSTAATIVSGAVAERMKYSSYIIATILLSALIYPIVGHWVWGGALEGKTTGWLGSRGFIDFAGSTVVHSVGGWISMAALITIGPRKGRFSDTGEARTIHGCNIPVAVLGVLLLWFGWLGFNGGSTLAMNDTVPGIIMRTTLAAAAGMAAALLFGWPLRKRPDATLVMNGCLAGLVAITAPCHAVNAFQSLLIGAVGGIIAILGEQFLEKIKIDDAVSAIPVHLFAGIWGTLAVALFGDLKILNTGLSRLDQFGVQALGIGVTAAWAFGGGLIFLKTINKVMPLRVSEEQEYKGLNVSEHGVSTEILDFFEVMDKQAETGDLNLRVPVEPFTEVGQIASRYNSVIDSLQTAIKEKEDILNTDIMKNIGQGLFILGTDGSIGQQYSLALEKILNHSSLGGQNFRQLVCSMVPEPARAGISDYLELILKQEVDEESLQMLCPLNEIELQLETGDGSFLTKSVHFEFHRILQKENIIGVLTTVQDITEQTELNRQLKQSEEKSRQEMELIFNILHVNPALLQDFLLETSEETACISSILQEEQTGVGYREKMREIFRIVHSIKGNASMMDLNFITEKAHAFEDCVAEALEQETLRGEDFLPLVFKLNELEETLSELKKLIEKLSGFQNAFEIKNSEYHERISQSLEKIALEQAANQAKQVKMDSSGFAGLQIPEEHYRPVKDVLIQLVRNAVSHGLENPEERIRAGKDQEGTITLSAKQTDAGYTFSLRDNGRGIQLNKIRDKAAATGRWSAEEINSWPASKVARCIFLPGFSTADSITTLAGRGIGMDIIADKIKTLDGRIRLSYKKNEYTEFKIELPCSRRN